MNETKKRFINIESKLVVASGEERRGNIRVEVWEVQTVGYKKRLAIRMDCATQRIEPVFCNNCKWSITFKTVSQYLHGAPVGIISRASCPIHPLDQLDRHSM